MWDIAVLVVVSIASHAFRCRALRGAMICTWARPSQARSSGRLEAFYDRYPYLKFIRELVLPLASDLGTL